MNGPLLLLSASLSLHKNRPSCACVERERDLVLLLTLIRGKVLNNSQAPNGSRT